MCDFSNDFRVKLVVGVYEPHDSVRVYQRIIRNYNLMMNTYIKELKTYQVFNMQTMSQKVHILRYFQTLKQCDLETKICKYQCFECEN